MKCLGALLLGLVVALTARADEVVLHYREANAPLVMQAVDAQLPALLVLYRELHASPELSLHEEETAARMADELAAAGFEVTREVGGTGVVGVLRNGAGPTLMLRADSDGLPVVEDTGLSYASRVRSVREDGSEVGVMHACGHDVHMANLVGAARLLADARAHWRGTLVAIVQPAEEKGKGALAMMRDGLFERFPRPDVVVALHVEPELAAGRVGAVSGWAMANVDAVDVAIFGRGGHGARPHQAIDPVVAAAHLVTALQTLVSRRVNPQDAAVVTVGAIHGGTKHNVIPDRVDLKLTVRSYTDAVRASLLDGIRQLAEDTCRSFQCPRPPEVTIKDEYTPALYNDPALVADASRLWQRVMGEDAVGEVRPSMGGEDFGRYARELGVPGMLFRLGATSPKLLASGDPVPTLHSSRFAPDAEPALRAGVISMSHLALALLAPPEDTP